jgi:hypothetical protein
MHKKRKAKFLYRPLGHPKIWKEEIQNNSEQNPQTKIVDPQTSKTEKSHAFWRTKITDWLMVFFTALLVIVTALLAIYTYQLFIKAKDQAGSAM